MQAQQHDGLRELATTRLARRLTLTAALSLAAVPVTLGWPALSSAQGPSTACAQIQADKDRLACYDRAFPREPAAGAPAAAAAAAAPVAAAPPAAPARSLPDAAPADVESHVATEPRTETRGARGSSTAQTAPTPAAPAAPATAAAARPAPAPAVEEQPDILPIVIVSVRDTPGRNAKVFTADNGSIWVQTDSVALNAPATPFNAQIKKGVVGSFFLVPTDKGRSVRVRRGN